MRGRVVHSGDPGSGREPALAVSSSPAAPTLTRPPGLRLHGRAEGNWPSVACRRALARREAVWCRERLGPLAGRGARVAAPDRAVADQPTRIPSACRRSASARHASRPVARTRRSAATSSPIRAPVPGIRAGASTRVRLRFQPRSLDRPVSDRQRMARPVPRPARILERVARVRSPAASRQPFFGSVVPDSDRIRT